ncbi:MAG TPA: hypothetical protein DEF88_01895 [Porphyromonadaceae bacterium]|jgi:thiol-disulfide isomerase/thioredoxin|nr:hypothetical protein [Porphyromonadaceae bacterium]HCM19953.1 hypothetical protein [Porphyromonadaceae bacterium]
MRKIFFILFVLSLFTIKSSGQTGTFFEKISFEEALKKSLDENKYVFVDCYTSWCGPCKKMSTQIFPQEKAGNYFNAKFINIAFDIEKEEDGKMIAEKYKIRSIPTFLIFKSDGALLSTIVGGSTDVDSFIKKVEESLEYEKMYNSIKKIYESNSSQKAFLLDALNGFSSIGDSAKLEVVKRLVKESTDEEKISRDYWFIYSGAHFSPPGSENESYLFKHYNAFRKSIGKEEVDRQLGDRYMRIVKEIAEGKKNVSPEELQSINLQINKLQLSKEYKLFQYITMAESVISKDIDNLIKTSEKFLPELNITLYFMLSEKILKEGTIEQNKRWITLGEKLQNIAPKDDMYIWTNTLIDHLKKKVNEKENIL